MNWFELLQPELLILVPFMYIMSYYLTLSKVNNRLIPFLMFLFSTVMVLLKYLFIDKQSFGGGISVVAVMQGAFLSMVVITGDQVIKAIFPKLLAKLEPTPLLAQKVKKIIEVVTPTEDGAAQTVAESTTATIAKVAESTTATIAKVAESTAATIANIAERATSATKEAVTKLAKTKGATSPLQALAEQETSIAEAARLKYNNLVKKTSAKEELPEGDEMPTSEDGE